MQLKYRDDITWQDMPRIERPFFARSKLSADLSGPRPRISRFAFKNPLCEAYRRFSTEIDPEGLKSLYRKIEQGSVMLVLTTEYDVFSPAFIWKEDPNHKDKGQWQLSQEISSEAEFSYELVHTTQQSRIQVGSGVDTRPALEIEAREELIKNRQEWGLTNDEVREAIKEIRQIRETGQY